MGAGINNNDTHILLTAHKKIIVLTSSEMKKSEHAIPDGLELKKSEHAIPVGGAPGARDGLEAASGNGGWDGCGGRW